MAMSEPKPFTYPTLWQPSDISEARNVAEQLNTGYLWASGTTLLRTQWEMGTVQVPKHLISLDRIRELKTISEDEEKLSIGAMCTLRLCGEHPLLKEQFNLVHAAVEAIAAPSIRNIATIGGNVASGVGDSIPSLLVYDASLLWGTEAGLDEKSLASWLKERKEGKQNASDLLLNIYVPKGTMDTGEGERSISFFKKIGRREAFTPSLVTVAFHGVLNREGHWMSVSIAAGGGSGYAMRLTQSETMLRGRKAELTFLPELATKISEEFETYTDLYATQQYRKQTASNLLVSGLWESLKS
ncbi:FAD binding domain-containing protein [Neobacillus mesonae]|nr:FAD binding domain-containing protein [Neobacillus mesonae]